MGEGTFQPTLTGLTEPPNQGLIEWLETALVSAKSGDLRHIAAVGIWRGRVVTTGWTPDLNSIAATALGGIRLLEHKLVLQCFESDAEMYGR